MPLQDILKDCGLVSASCQPVHGGDINKCYRVRTPAGQYFLKVNNAGQYPAMFEREAEGLVALRSSCTLAVPEIIAQGISGHEQYLLLQWLEQSNTGSQEIFGSLLAEMHQRPQPYFGWTTNNYIGSLPQINTRHTSWAAFYADCRILPMVKMLADSKHLGTADVRHAESLCCKLYQLFPDEAPTLLHGDLWSGNYMMTANGAAIYDPAVYLGHREMDIGMTLLFGGFDSGFYEGYNAVYPLEAGWQQRVLLAQLYPLLVHAVLFGAGYAQRAREAIAKYA